MLKEYATLTEGVLYKNKKYRHILMRGPIISDSVKAEKIAEGKGPLVLSLAFVSALILNFGETDENGTFIDEIPKEDITPDLLAQLSEIDFEMLIEVRDFLKKKVRWSRRD